MPKFDGSVTVTPCVVVVVAVVVWLRQRGRMRDMALKPLAWAASLGLFHHD